MVFTGYPWAELQSMDLPFARELICYTDILVDGPYIAEQPETRRNWVGSSNQRFYYFSDVYSREVEIDPRYSPSAEIRLGSAGSLVFNGMAGLVKLKGREASR